MIGSRRRKRKESGMRRVEFRELAEKTQKPSRSRATDLAVASALFLVAVTVRFIRYREFDKSERTMIPSNSAV